MTKLGNCFNLMTFIFKSCLKNLLFKYNNFHEFSFYIIIFIFLIVLNIKMMSFHDVGDDRSFGSVKNENNKNCYI